MIIERGENKLRELVKHQLRNIFFLEDMESDLLDEVFESALSRSDYCFSNLKAFKGFSRNGKTYFTPYHTGQYGIFLYFLSNSAWNKAKDSSQLADKVFALNKMLHGVDLFYEVEMPKVFFCDHPIGSVIGRATIGEFFSFAQNCTVGNNHGVYPTIGTNVQMLSGSMVIGQSHIHDNVIISARAYIKDENIPENSLVFGASPNLTIKPRKDI